MNNISAIVLFHNNNLFNMVIDALLKQRMEGDEIVIVNDHSSEEYLKILEIYKEVPNLRIVNSDVPNNRGRNRNLGALMSKNNFLLFVDGDMVLMDGTLQQIRTALIAGYVGVYGNILQGGDTPEQMSLKVGFDYLQFLQTNPKLEDFCKNSIATDKRSGLLKNNILSHTEWQYFYSGYCATTKEKFFMVGGFNETFEGWGAEDVEFGYRLSRTGELRYLYNAYAFHISHNRDIYKIMINNKKNLYKFLSQCPNSEIELYITFHLNDKIVETYKYIKEKVISLQLNTEHRLSKQGELSILPVSSKYPNGSVAYIDANNKLQSLSLVGLALPFCDRQFDCVNLDTDIFCYPEAISAKILQESCRVAACVNIYKNKRREHLHWNNLETNSLITRRSNMDRVNYLSHNISDFMFEDVGDRYIIVGGVATVMPYVNINNLPDIYPNREKPDFNCVLFDLIGELTDEQIEQISRENHLNVYGVYKLPHKAEKVCLSEKFFGEIQTLNIPFAYIVDSSMAIDKSDSWWDLKKRRQDRIIFYQI